MSLTFSEFLKMLPLDGRNKQYELQLSCDGDCNLVGPRQDGKTTMATAHLIWKALTTPNSTIGITSSTRNMSIDVLYKLKELIKDANMLDMVIVNNKTTIEFRNGSRIITSVLNGDAFRGWSINYLYIDEITYANPNNLREFMDCILPSIHALKDTKIITSSYRGW